MHELGEGTNIEYAGLVNFRIFLRRGKKERIREHCAQRDRWPWYDRAYRVLLTRVRRGHAVRLEVWLVAHVVPYRFKTRVLPTGEHVL